MTDLSVLFTCFVALVFAVGPALMPTRLGSPLTRVATGAAASLGILYLAGFGIYALALPAATHWLLLGLPLLVGVVRRDALLELWADPEVRRGMLGWLALVCWLLGWQCMIASYSGATWQVDWHEHFHRTRFFLERWDPHHRFIGVFSLAARPPLANVVTAEFLALAGNKFAVYQAASLLLGSLVIWPVFLLQRRFTRTGEPVHFGWVVLLLLGLPSLVQNGVFPWTKLCTTFFVLTGIALCSEKKGDFGLRMAGWLSLTAGMLAHYSAGPWIVAMTVAGFISSPERWRAIFSRQGLLTVGVCILLFGTWLGWSMVQLGAAETFGSNTTVTSGEGLTVRHRLKNAGDNLYYTTVPALFRHVDDTKYLYRSEDAVVRLRDLYFNSTQSSILMIAGLFGVVVATALLWVERTEHRWSGARYWATLIGIGLVLGTIVHTDVSEPGVAHICLLPLAFLVVAWLAARVSTHPWLRGLLISGLVVDVLLGIVLHFAIQSLALPRWLHPGESDFELVQRLGLIARENLKAKLLVTGPFIADMAGASVVAFVLLGGAVTMAVASFRLRRPRVSSHAASSERGAPSITPGSSSIQAKGSEARAAMAIFAVCLAFHFWGIQVGWGSRSLPGGESSQARTALAAYWINAENNFSLVQTTAMLDKPWSTPAELPLYQWVTVVVTKLTNWGLTKAGRAVSVACFYLTLPAVFLLLARWQVAATRRWLVLALVVTCPFYIFYARAFLPETMALMFSVWFWVACERAVNERNKGWLAVAMIAGTGAGLVKFTTFTLYLLPVGAWIAARLWTRRRGGWKPELAWIAATLAIPLAATFCWVQHAHAVQAQNTLTELIGSGSVENIDHGPIRSLFIAELWTMKWRMVREELTWFPAVLVCAALAVWTSRNRLPVLGCTALFASAWVIFPVAYGRNEYSYAASALWLLLAMSLTLIAVLESKIFRRAAYVIFGLILLGQMGHYLEHYYPVQRLAGSGGDDLSISLRRVTSPDDVVVVIGQGWDSTTAYYAQRRALMLDNELISNPARTKQALATLTGKKIGALAVVGHPDNEQSFIDWASAHGLATEPLYMRRDARVYMRPELRVGLPLTVPDEFLFQTEHGRELPRKSAPATWLDVARLSPSEALLFSGMQPRPKLAWATFGPALNGSSGVPLYGAHPVTRLIFALPAGRHQLKTSLQMPEDAYRRELADIEASDGVEVRLRQISPVRRVLGTRYFDPRHNPDDRGSLRPLSFTFTLEQEGEVELYFGPGPAEQYARDWIQMGPLTIEPARD